jgi:hypothetical protein
MVVVNYQSRVMDMILVTSKKKVSVYLNERLKGDAERLARSELRSLNNLIELLLQEAVDKAKKEGRINHEN